MAKELETFKKLNDQEKILDNKNYVSDQAGHYDLDGVTQSQDFQVIVASDKMSQSSPFKISGFELTKIKFEKWLSHWKDEDS